MPISSQQNFLWISNSKVKLEFIIIDKFILLRNHAVLSIHFQVLHDLFLGSGWPRHILKHSIPETFALIQWEMSARVTG